MDASKFVDGKGDESGKKFRRTELANELRDLADQIEAGSRVVTEMHSYEMVGQEYPTSILILKSSHYRR